METVPVNVTVRRAGETSTFLTELEFARTLATLMDSQFQIGPVKFGVDAILGLIPVVGDTISVAAGVYPIHLARKYNLGRTVVARMWANLAVDFAGGLVPLVGDALDVWLKSNLKNLKLLEDAGRKRGLL
jgi:hypothetical protein